jgi:hypothetical protein
MKLKNKKVITVKKDCFYDDKGNCLNTTDTPLVGLIYTKNGFDNLIVFCNKFNGSKLYLDPETLKIVHVHSTNKELENEYNKDESKLSVDISAIYEGVAFLMTKEHNRTLHLYNIQKDIKVRSILAASIEQSGAILDKLGVGLKEEVNNVAPINKNSKIIIN